mgnify:CR=1 FL=1
MKSVRMERINSELAKVISYVVDHELRDPQINAMVSVCGVEVTPDLGYARVYITSMGTTPPEEVLARIKGAGGFIRREVSQRIKLRATPRLEFMLDTSSAYSAQIDSVLKTITYATQPDEESDA